MHSRPRRTLARALIVSLLVHAGLLIGVVRVLPARLEAPAPAMRVVAMSRNAGGAFPPSASAAAEIPASRGAAPARRKPEIVEKPVPAESRLADSRPRETAVPAASSPSSPPAGAIAEPAAAPPSAPAGAPAGSRAGAGNAASGPSPADKPAGQGDAAVGVSADDLRQYRFALGGSARRFKRYPPLAKERGWEGRVEIALDFRRLHAEPVLSLSASSGKRMLDEQALETLRQAVRRTELPEGLKGKDFRMLQEIVFSLEDGG